MLDGLVNFEYNEADATIIKVIGVGGGGGNAVKYMYKRGIRNVDFVICNTDAQVFEDGSITRIQLGTKLTEGLGAGNNPAIGAQAAAESIEDIRDMLSHNTRMAFITAALGGGTGTGAAPVIARLAKDMGILTVGIVSIPARFEGPKRIEQARAGLQRMKESVDSLIVVDNQKIMQIYSSNTMSAAFGKANEVLNIAVKGIAEIITLSGYINVDFADVRTVMSDSGVAVMGASVVSGQDRAHRAINEALESPLLNNNEINGARDILFNITYGTEEITVKELQEITSTILNRVGDSASVIWGVGQDISFGDAISVTVIATGFLKDSIEIEDEEKENDVVEILQDVVLRPGLSVEEIENLKKVPAYERRKHIRVL